MAKKELNIRVKILGDKVIIRHKATFCDPPAIKILATPNTNIPVLIKDIKVVRCYS